MDWEIVDESPVVPVELGGLKKKSAEIEQPTKLKHVSEVEHGIRKEAPSMKRPLDIGRASCSRCHISPLAYGMVDSENDASWTWFFQNLKEAYGKRQNMCVVSDRNPSIIKAVSDMYNDVPHYACMWHQWGNVKKLYRKSHDALSEVKNYLELAGYEKWARSYAIVNRGWTLTSNIAESINGVLVSSRELSIYDFLEEFRLLFAKWNCENRQQVSYTFTPLIEKFYDILKENEALCTQMTIPCAHACAVLEKKNFEKGPYCCDLFKPKIILKTYDVPIYPLPHKDDWLISKSVLSEIVLPPKYKRPPGRPAKKYRGKSRHDMFRKKNINSCGACGAKGHNRRSCRKYRKMKHFSFRISA
ncbi:uncharacterized protein LOC124885669 [Capsicum annuum]|uniref:uncharacterized protein LOC124885669 n=1 Tax=Capsicum annuum TaxID=4072 RepID=UPI001FB193B9|nr:uncharacterized protein LOC124885669 [Capsicum annuum]